MLKNRVKELRNRLNLNQQELAGKIGVSRQTISSIEGGNYNPSIQLALLMARIFKVNVEDVFYLEDQENEV